MDVELIPVVYWITRQPDAGYAESLNDVLRSLRPFAESMLARHAPRDRSGLDADALIYEVLLDLQRTLLDQYLPEVEANRVRSFASLWPWWDKGEMKVAADGRVVTIPVPAEDDATHVLDGCGWTYRLYRTETQKQRLRWIFHLIKDRSRKQGRAIRDHLPLDENFAAPGDPPVKRGAFGDAGDFRDLFSITDPADWRDANARGDPKTRKRCQRATQRLVAGFKILELSITQAVAKAYLKRLVEAEGNERRGILNDFYRRYLRKDAE